MKNKKRNEKQKEILDKIPKKESGIIYVAQRIGKTKIAIDLIKRDKPKKVLWVTPSKLLVEEGIKKDFAKFKAKREYKKVDCVTWRSLYKIEDHYDLIILDEIHHITSKNSASLLSGSLSYDNILGMSGTVTKSFEKKNLMQKLKLKVFVDYNIVNGVSDEILSNYMINVVFTKLSKIKDIEVKTKNYHFFTSEQKSYDRLSRIIDEAKIFGKSSRFHSFERMRLLGRIKRKMEFVKYFISKKEDERSLIFVNTKKLAETYPYYYHSTSDDKWLKAFQDEKIPYLVLVNKGGTGMTFHNIDNVIITIADSDINGQTVQKIMRGMLKDTKMLNIYITCVKHARDHEWTENVLSNFDKDKIKFYKF